MKAMGIVRLIQDGEVILETKNHMTHHILRTIFTQIIMTYFRKSTGNTTYVYTLQTYFPGLGFKITLGKGDAIPTFNTNAMMSPVIDITSTQTLVDNYATGGNMDLIYTGVINGETLSEAFGTDLLSEMGLYAYGHTFPTTPGWYLYDTTLAYVYLGNSDYNLIGYISASGNDLIPANIDTSKALAVEWILRFAPDVIV